MRMSRLEKVFVNSPSHSRQVARRMAGWLNGLPVRPGQRYLDVGCGNGAAAIHVARTYGLDVTAVDVDLRQIAVAARTANGLDLVTFKRCDATNLPFGDGTFDIVASSKTLHHVPRWESVIDEMARVLRPGGYVIIGDLALPSRLAGVLRPVIGRRAGVFARRDIERRCEHRGLQLVRRGHAAFHYEGVFTLAPIVEGGSSAESEETDA